MTHARSHAERPRRLAELAAALAALVLAAPTAGCNANRVVPYEPPCLKNPDLCSSGPPPASAPSEAGSPPAAAGPSEPRPPLEVPVPDDFEGTLTATAVPRPNAPASAVRDLRTGGHRGFDRIIVDFAGPNVPGYHVAFVDAPPLRCDTREPVRVAGAGALLLRMSPTEIDVDPNTGQPRLLACQRDLALESVRELELVCNRAGEVAILVGLREARPYRVVELEAPARLVIDVRQP